MNFSILELSNIEENSLPEPEQFGYNNGYFKIENGWLTEETVIQFKIFNNPIKLWKNRLQNRKVHIKVRVKIGYSFGNRKKSKIKINL